MTWYHIISLIALVLCLTSLAFHLIRLLRIGPPIDYARQRGNVAQAVRYSYLGAMDPRKKESAYLHLPTYTAGLLYHSGTFISLVLFPLLFSGVLIGDVLRWCVAGFLMLSAGSGLGIFMKRLAVSKIRSLSNPDDYVSNLLVTLFQFSTLTVMLRDGFAPYYFVSASLLFLYLPFGKLKHVLYFFAARYQLGLFYGRRGIWPLRRN